MTEFSSQPVPNSLESVYCAICSRQAPKQDTFMLADAHYCALCKPQILLRLAEGKPLVSPASELMRKAYIAHESSVKSIGLLYFLAGPILGLAGVGLAMSQLAAASAQDAAQAPTSYFHLPLFLVGPFFIVLSIAYIWTGVGLRRLRPWSRVSCGILSGIGLLGYPLGTLINAYFLYLILSKKGQVVFSPGYLAVIEQTPHIRYKTSKVAWILLGLLVLLILLAIVGNHRIEHR